jgi:hypothetical protein
LLNMSLPINPQSKLVAQVSSALGQAAAELQSAGPSVASAISKAGLDDKIASLSGGIGSGLNGATSALKDAAGSLGDLGGAAGAFGDIASVASSAVGYSPLSGLASVAGSISNIGADISGSLNKLTGGNLAGGLMDLAGAISKGAGVLNNILSLKRGANLPAGAELFEQRGQAIKLNPGARDDWRVRISCDWSLFNSPLFNRLQETGGVVWPYLPQISFSSKANYNAVESVHSNYPFYAYKNSVVDDITISGDFSAENSLDAAYWIAATMFFKTATKMFFGQGENAGNPPIICQLNGYGASMFNNVPVVVKSFQVDLPDDVNYIKCDVWGTNTWVPIMSNISVTVTPVYNRRDLRQFSLEKFGRGQMVAPSGVGYI